jgi:5'(3')-deoxyribonucleotidase
MDKIFVDLDGCVYNFLNAFWDELIWYHGYSEDQYCDYMNYPNKYILTPLGRQLLQVPIIYERIKALPEDIETLNQLSKLYEIWYVTSRPESCFLATKHWLTREHFPKGNIVFTQDKGKLAEQEKPVFAVEDQIHHIEAMSPHTTVFVVHHNYNENYKTNFRIKKLSQLLGV